MKKQIVLNDQNVEIDVVEQSSNFVLFKFEGKEYGINLESGRDGKYILNYSGANYGVVSNGRSFVMDGHEIEVALPNRKRNKNQNDHHGAMISPMPGKILKILKSEGETVSKGDAILVMEAMKMEHTIKASADGKIEKIFFKEGDQVQAKVELVKLC